MKMKQKLAEIIHLQLFVHSNEMACRKRVRLGMDLVSETHSLQDLVDKGIQKYA